MAKKKHYTADKKKPLKGRAPRRKRSGQSSYGVAFREGAAESRRRRTRPVHKTVTKKEL